MHEEIREWISTFLILSGALLTLCGISDKILLGIKKIKKHYTQLRKGK